jgi:hypothetical protein
VLGYSFVPNGQRGRSGDQTELAVTILDSLASESRREERLDPEEIVFGRKNEAA